MIKFLLRQYSLSAFRILYIFIYIIPVDLYFFLKSLLGLQRHIEYKGKNSLSKKICIFSIFPSKPESSFELLVHQIKSIKDVGYSIILVSNKKISKERVNLLKNLCVKLIIRDNYGLDFAGYKLGILSHKKEISTADSLLIINDSVLGPVVDLKKIFSDMDTQHNDFWGMNETYVKLFEKYHIGSYFIVFKQSVITSKVFWQFWERYSPSCSRVRTIARGEIKLSEKLVSYGFLPDAVITMRAIDNYLKTQFNALIKKDDDYKNNFLHKILNKACPGVTKTLLKTVSGYGARGLTVDASILHSLKEVVYSSNLYVSFWHTMIELGYPFIKKDLLYRQHYYPGDIISTLEKYSKLLDPESAFQELQFILIIKKPHELLYKILAAIGER